MLPPDPVRRPWLRWLIVVSLGLNLFLLGFIAAQTWQLRHSYRPDVAGVAGATGEPLRRIADALPPHDRVLLQSAFAARQSELAGLHRRWRAAIGQVRADIAAEKFDAEQLQADLATAKATRQATVEVIEQVVLSALPDMSPEGRKRLSQNRLLMGR